MYIGVSGNFKKQNTTIIMFILKFRLKILIYFGSQYMQKLSAYIVLFSQWIDVSYRPIAVATIYKDKMCQYQGDIRQCVFSATACNFKTVQFFFKSTQWLEEMKNRGLLSKQSQRKEIEKKRLLSTKTNTHSGSEQKKQRIVRCLYVKTSGDNGYISLAYETSIYLSHVI